MSRPGRLRLFTLLGCLLCIASGGASGFAGCGRGGGATAGSGGKGGGSTGSGGATGVGGAALGMLAGNGCAGSTCLNPTCQPLTTAAPIGTYADIGFELRPTYIPNDVIIPTFDDVPDPVHTAADGVLFTNFGAGNWTQKMLQYFDANNLHVDFFINTNNFCNLAVNPDCVTTLASILKNHNPANHSVHHAHMGGDTAFDPKDYAASSCGFAAGSQLGCDDELKGVETLVNTVSNGGRPHLTRFRSPYGEPFQAGAPRLTEMRGLVSKYALHIGWQMDSEDSMCDDCRYTGAMIADNVQKLLGNAPGAGQWGIVLMHGTYPWTFDAVKLLLDPATGFARTHGFRVGTVEDAVCWKYGKHSWEIIAQLSGQPRGPN